MSDYRRYWDEARETMPTAERERRILERIKAQLDFVYHRTPFYRALYDRHGVHPDDVRSLPEFTEKIPVVTKVMLREAQERHPPFGDYLGIDPEDVMRVQGTSGTTGAPTLFAISRDDWTHVAEAQAMQSWAAGLRPNDIVQIAFPLNLFVGGWGHLAAAERMGATVLPVGGGASERQIALMRQVGSTAICATPSYCLHLLDVAADMGVDAAAGPLRLGFFGGEPGGGIPAVKKRLEQGWGIHAIDFGNVAEVHPCSNMECEERTGMHVYQDVDYTEIVHPERPNEAVPLGTRGAVVYTHLWRRSQPMIRYFPGDETRMVDDPCPCGRTYPRLPDGILGRLDDMIIVRGVKFYPSTVEAALREIPGIGTEFRIILERTGALDQARIEAEHLPGLAEGGEAEALAGLGAQAEARLRAIIGIRLPVTVLAPGRLEPTAFKARRVIDRRAPLDKTA